jgi:hypothetical protein
VGRTHSSGESAPLRAARCPAGRVTTSGHHEAQRTSSGRRQAPSPGVAATGNASPFDPAGTGHRAGSRLSVQSVASGFGAKPDRGPACSPLDRAAASRTVMLEKPHRYKLSARPSRSKQTVQCGTGLGAGGAQLPSGPGDYRFRDGEGEVLYVGRAAQLRSRVASTGRISAIGGSNRWWLRRPRSRPWCAAHDVRRRGWSATCWRVLHYRPGTGLRAASRRLRVVARCPGALRCAVSAASGLDIATIRSRCDLPPDGEPGFLD